MTTETMATQPIFEAIVERLEGIKSRIQGINNTLYDKADGLFGPQPPNEKSTTPDQCLANCATERVNQAVNDIFDSLNSLEDTQARFNNLV